MYSLKTHQIHEQTSKSGVPVMGCGRGRVAGGLQTLLDRDTKSKAIKWVTPTNPHSYRLTNRISVDDVVIGRNQILLKSLQRA